MLAKHKELDGQMEFVVLEELVPADHLLRKIKAAIKFDKIRPATRITSLLDFSIILLHK